MTWLLTVACGAVFGFCFGLTSVGSVFAVPLLTYALGLPPHSAVCVSMVSVSVCSAIASLLKFRQVQIEHRSAATMAVAGTAAAPLGAWIGRMLPSRWLMAGFAIFVICIALRLLLRRSDAPAASAGSDRHFVALFLTGALVGIIAGLLGVGGVLIAPALVFLAGFSLDRAIATTPPIVLIIGLSAVISHFVAGQRIPLQTTALFAATGIAGMLLGQRIGAACSPSRLQTAFAIAMLVVAVLVIARTLSGS